jgi:hypothetical protein
MMTDERIKLIFAKAAILVETIMTATDITCLPQVRRTFSFFSPTRPPARPPPPSLTSFPIHHPLLPLNPSPTNFTFQSRSPVAWKEIMTLTNTDDLSQTKTVAGRMIALGVIWRVCMTVRPNIFGEYCSGMFYMWDLAKAARKVRRRGPEKTIYKSRKMTLTP